MLFTVTWKIMDTSTFADCLTSSNPEFQKNCSIDLTPNKFKNSDFLSVLYSKPLRKFIETKFKLEDKIGLSIHDFSSREIYETQFTEEVFEIVAVSHEYLQDTQ